MSIVPASSLSGPDLRQLGNNLAAPHAGRARRQRRRARLAAVNRSLAVVGEQVTRLYRTRLGVSGLRDA